MYRVLLINNILVQALKFCKQFLKIGEDLSTFALLFLSLSFSFSIWQEEALLVLANSMVVVGAGSSDINYVVFSAYICSLIFV
jgi:hypothetical protein